jgi:hypothetical protein
MVDSRDAKVVNVQLYRVTFNSDSMEGRGFTSYEWYVDPTIANSRAKGNYGMGTDCPVDVIYAAIIVVGDEMYRLGEQIKLHYEDPREVRERALAKLTPEERKVLGIKD